MGSTAREIRPREAGARVCEHYVLEGIVREGALATQYLARSEGEADARFIAWVVRPELVADPAKEFALAGAFEILRSLRIRGVPRVADFDVSGPRPVLVTARVDGETVRDRLAIHRSMAPAEVSRMVMELAEIIDTLHARTPPIVHRAVQPENVVIDAKGGYWLEETGLAWALAEAEMLPEDVQQWLRPRTDVVMLSTLAFRCLAGSVSATLNRGPRNANDGPPGTVPTAADAVLLRGWNAEPDQQYPTAGALARELARAVGSFPPPKTNDDVDRAFDSLFTDTEDPPPGDSAARQGPIESGRVPRVRSSNPPPMPSRPPPSALPSRPPPALPSRPPPSALPSRPPDAPRMQQRPPERDRPTLPMEDPLVALKALSATELRPTAPPSTPPSTPPPRMPSAALSAPTMGVLAVAAQRESTAAVGTEARAIRRAIVRGARIVAGSLLLSTAVLSASVYWAGGRIDQSVRTLQSTGFTRARTSRRPLALPTPGAPADPPAAAPASAARETPGYHLYGNAPGVVAALPAVPTLPETVHGMSQGVAAQPADTTLNGPVQLRTLMGVHRPPDDALYAARRSITGAVGDCIVGSDASMVEIRAVFQGATGAADRIDFSSNMGEPPTGPCLVHAMRKVRLPRFDADTYTVRWFFHVPPP